jgi:uncharacterized protein (TIGR02996 family)
MQPTETAMSDGEALLRTILLCPEDDTARLVFADWLDENGQPHRAECIRAQIAYAQDGKWTPAAGVRIAEEKQWFGFPRECCSDCKWWRGFVWKIHLLTVDFFKHAEAIFAAHPVASVVLTDRRPGTWGGPGQRKVIGFRYWYDGGGMEHIGYWAHHVPKELCPLSSGIRPRRGPRGGVFFPTEAEANAAFSEKCVAYGRKLAGLTADELVTA